MIQTTTNLITIRKHSNITGGVREMLSESRRSKKILQTESKQKMINNTDYQSPSSAQLVSSTSFSAKKSSRIPAS